MDQAELKRILRYNPDTGVFRWKVGGGRRSVGKVAGTINHDGYVIICVDRKLHRAHRLAWFYVYGVWPTQLDHINCVPDDNRIVNLREVTGHQNQQNRKFVNSNNKSGYLGVSWSYQDDKWVATRGFKGKTIRIGLFDCPKEAHQAYLNSKE